MDVALNLWSEAVHDLDKISRTTKLSIEQVKRAITVAWSALNFNRKDVKVW